MKSNRRSFLKIAGAAALGASVSPALKAVDAVAEEFAPNETAVTAKHWAMVINTKEFETAEDFQPLIEACHSFHNVPNIEGPQEIKWLWTDSFHHTFPEKATEYLDETSHHHKYLLLCNHCENPSCVRACPTKATFKRESDGIVIMDMHRCIGCRFCMAACPFGARSFNFQDPRPYIEDTNPDYPTRMRGVVEKCNFCAERLAVGQMPLCVEASEGKILFGDLADPDSEVRAALRENFTLRRKPSAGTGPSVYYII